MTTTTPPPLYQGRSCACVPAGPERYHLVARDGRVIGEIQWHARQQLWTFVPAPGTRWTSGTLGDIGLWLRRLARVTHAERRPDVDGQ
jgi:hypothetical protein